MCQIRIERRLAVCSERDYVYVRISPYGGFNVCNYPIHAWRINYGRDRLCRREFAIYAVKITAFLRRRQIDTERRAEAAGTNGSENYIQLLPCAFFLY